jgi:hypothetical protein
LLAGGLPEDFANTDQITKGNTGMKKQTLFGFTISALFLFFGSLSAFAQSQNNLITVRIPFDFQVDEKQFPAGEYVIRCDSKTRRIQVIQHAQQNIVESIYTIPHTLSKEPTLTSLIFREYGDKHFLSEVKIQGHGNGYALIRSKTERKLAQNLEAKTVRAIPNNPGQTTEQQD